MGGLRNGGPGGGGGRDGGPRDGEQLVGHVAPLLLASDFWGDPQGGPGGLKGLVAQEGSGATPGDVGATCDPPRPLCCHHLGPHEGYGCRRGDVTSLLTRGPPCLPSPPPKSPPRGSGGARNLLRVGRRPLPLQPRPHRPLLPPQVPGSASAASTGAEKGRGRLCWSQLWEPGDLRDPPDETLVTPLQLPPPPSPTCPSVPNTRDPLRTPPPLDCNGKLALFPPGNGRFGPKLQPCKSGGPPPPPPELSPLGVGEVRAEQINTISPV
ncbi:uncharacterized protein LOC127465033 [Manacus candei]|uniref:uncharacterized protein LOC127465033 n=1 Tax=Manacus candei TaxID=415023 RepID=UPI002227C81D|nr:uncharacterized protein LOC127465033 [Manacus candei]